MTQLLYDGSFEGLLTAFFTAFEYKIQNPLFLPEYKKEMDSFFSEDQQVITQDKKAERIMQFLEEKIGKDGIRTLLFAFLSEVACEDALFHVVKKAVEKPEISPLKNFADEKILSIHKLVISVGREKHRMEAFLRFELMKDELFAAKIAPDFNVCGLIVPHFKNRYADQKWLIFDILRGYGFYWDKKSIAEITEVTEEFLKSIPNPVHMLHENEVLYQNLWQSYFNKTNIKERKNMKLHLQHVPRRYWKYLTEKWNT